MASKSVILSVLLVFLVQLSYAEIVELKTAETPFQVQVINSSLDRTVLKFSVNSYQKRDVSIDGKNFLLLEKLRKESTIEEKGYPRLPRINRSIIIPDQGVMGFTVLSADYIEIGNIDLAPSKGHLPRTIDPETVPYTFGEIYNKAEFFPAELVNLSQPYILRDFRGMVVELNAFQYNPVKRVLRVYTDAVVEVKKIDSGGENILLREKPLTKMDPQFEKIYRRHFLNFNPSDYPVLLEGGGMLVISYDSFMDEMEPFVEWKNQKGIPAEMVPVSEAGSTPEAIRNYIRNYYNQHDLGYVLLVGDAPQVPTFSDDSDPVYTLLVGGDNYADIFVGRFSAENSAQVETQVERTINYEKYPNPAGDWYSKGLGDADEDGPCNPEPYDYQHISIIANRLMRWNYTQVDSVYTVYGGTTAMIMNALNQGRSIFNYAGHGWINMVGPVNFTSTNANQLVNDNKLFHFVAVACQPGNFVGNTCLAEDLLRATNHATGAPTGSIAVFLSRISQSWFPPYDMQDEGIDLLVADSMLTFGGMCYNGSMLMIDLFGNQGINEFNAWTLFGDPSVYLRSATPYPLTVVHNPEIPVGMGNFEVTVSSPTGPLPGATVCAMNDNLYATGVTDNSGFVSLTFDPPPLVPGSFTLTVYSSNAIPYITQVNIIPVSGPYVIFNNCVIQDGITGNNNGQLDYGETVDLGIALENVGLAITGNVSGILSTVDTIVTILEDSACFGQIQPDSIVMLDGAYQIQISPEVEDGHPVLFSLELTDGLNNWESNFSIFAHAPDITFAGLSIDDSVGGNGNGNLDPGETAILNVVLENSGSSDAFSVIAELTSADPNVTINSAFSSCGDMLAGGSALANFEVTVSNTCPQNYDLNFEIDLSGSGGFTDVTEFTTTVGDIMYLPTGPDEYGYSAYDPYDAPEFPNYDWVEISPDSGGSGTLVPFINDDQVLYFQLPFQFRYYGSDYDTITISSNGFLAMGVVADDYSNSQIPNADGPPAMIASYWEDLSPQRDNSGRVWQYYDAINHLYIVEFNHIEQYAPTGNFETFQTILYDPVYYATFTGDGRIKVQYKNMSVASQTEGTIGIENADETIGLQYFFDGDYDTYAFPIINETAILFTTPVTAPGITVTLTPLNPPIVIPPGGGSFQYTVEIGNSGTVAINFDIWMEATLPNGNIYGPIILRENLNINPGAVITRNMTQYIPGGAPAGTYIYRCNTGNYPAVVFAYDEFNFSKSGFANQGGNGDWELTGWDVENQNLSVTVPEDYYLAQNSPNPFNPITIISFGLPEGCRIEIKIYDVLGREAAILYKGWMNAGAHSLTFEASGLTSGIYFYTLKTEAFTSTRKFLLLK